MPVLSLLEGWTVKAVVAGEGAVSPARLEASVDVVMPLVCLRVPPGTTPRQHASLSDSIAAALAPPMDSGRVVSADMKPVVDAVPCSSTQLFQKVSADTLGRFVEN